MSTRGFITVLRDLVSLGLGTYIVLHEVITDRVNLYLLGFASLAIGIPGVAGLIEILRNIQSASGTPSPPSSSLPPSSSPPQSSSASTT